MAEGGRGIKPPGGKGAEPPADRPDGTATACLATVTTEEFLPGTLVALHSFALRHPNFAGDVVVICDELSTMARRMLRAICPRVQLMPVSAALRQRVSAFGEAKPAFGDALPRFFALDVFRLRGYRKVLYCDSDLVFRQPIDELFDRSEALLCCGDMVQLLGMDRSAASFGPVEPTDHPAGALRQTFNDGLLLIDAALLTAQHHAELLAMLAPENWPDGTDHTKQLLQNRYFAGCQTLVSSTYNFLLRSAADIQRREGITADEAKVVHFNYLAKPWMPAATLAQTLELPTPLAWSFWYEAWLQCLSTLHLRASALADWWAE